MIIKTKPHIMRFCFYLIRPRVFKKPTVFQRSLIAQGQGSPHLSLCRRTSSDWAPAHLFFLLKKHSSAVQPWTQAKLLFCFPGTKKSLKSDFFLCPGPGLNWRPLALQANALPTELPGLLLILIARYRC